MLLKSHLPKSYGDTIRVREAAGSIKPGAQAPGSCAPISSE